MYEKLKKHIPLLLLCLSITEASIIYQQYVTINGLRFFVRANSDMFIEDQASQLIKLKMIDRSLKTPDGNNNLLKGLIETQEKSVNNYLTEKDINSHVKESLQSSIDYH